MMAHNYVPRVTQLDAHQLDEEVVELFKNQVAETTKFLSPGGALSTAGPEIELLLRSVIFRYSVFNNSKTFGQQMLSLRYDDTNFSNGKKYWFYAYTILLKYLKDRLQFSYASNARAQSFLAGVERFQIVGDFFNLIRFLQTGKNSSLIDYVLNLEMASEVAIRSHYSDFSWAREMLWHSFIELFGVLAPYINNRRVKQIVREKLIDRFKKTRVSEGIRNTNVVPVMNQNTKCAECGGNPIIPHFMGCDHIFCHYCLESHKLENPNYRCPKCGFRGSSVQKVPSG